VLHVPLRIALLPRPTISISQSGSSRPPYPYPNPAVPDHHIHIPIRRSRPSFHILLLKTCISSVSVGGHQNHVDSCGSWLRFQCSLVLTLSEPCVVSDVVDLSVDSLASVNP
ncbi:hypothetical protein AVEN_99775-1, partial [Araneus ventricosus]